MAVTHHETTFASPPTGSGELGFEAAVTQRDTAVLTAIGGVPLAAEVATATEKLHHRSLVSMEIAPGQTVSLSSLENFKPKVPPGSPAHDVPDNIRRFTDETYQSSTLHATTSRALWERRTAEVAEDYMMHHADGQKLTAELGITSLRQLTPEQAVKFSTEFVRSVSKYSYDDTKSKGPTHADQTASFDLLREGLDFRGDPNWGGNGVCRNIAANVKAVFDALKSLQTGDTMLANTHCIIDRGQDGDGYNDERDNPLLTKLTSEGGHAWNIFTTVGENGSAVVTIADSTWALGEKPAAGADRTMERAGRFVDELFTASSDKSKAFDELTHYYDRLARSASTGVRPEERTRVQEFALTQYLWAARQMDSQEIDTQVPDILLGVAYRASGHLDPSELETLYRCDKVTGGVETERLGAIAKRAFETNHYTGSYLAARFTTADDAYQRFLFDAIGEQNVVKMADADPTFRVRARELSSVLPPFTMENPMDVRELMGLAEKVGVHAANAKEAVRSVEQLVKRTALRIGLDEHVAEAITAGRSPYDLVKAAPVIIASLRGTRKT